MPLPSLLLSCARSAAAVLNEAARCLRPGGAFFMVSAEAPELRLASFERAAEVAAAMRDTAATAATPPPPWKVKCQDVSLDGAQYDAFLYTAEIPLPR